MRTLVLWDIDHTLLSIKVLSKEIYGEVFHEVTGRPLGLLAPMAGRTDLAITAETLRLNDVDPAPRLVQTFTAALADRFVRRRHEINAGGRVLPGARSALQRLAGDPRVIQSALTGNMREIAFCKLAAFDLHPFMDLEVGAYGCDDSERPPLVGLAQRRASAKYDETFDAARTVLIGDTPHDVRAGHEGGARVLAVATGATSEEALRLAGADHVLPDLSDTETVLQAIL